MSSRNNDTTAGCIGYTVVIALLAVAAAFWNQSPGNGGGQGRQSPTPTKKVIATPAPTATAMSLAPIWPIPTQEVATYIQTCPYTNANSNLRAGPGTNYEKLDLMREGTCLPITARNATGDWLAFREPSSYGEYVNVWIFAELVSDAPSNLVVISSNSSNSNTSGYEEGDDGYYDGKIRAYLSEYEDYQDSIATDKAQDYLAAQAEYNDMMTQEAMYQADIGNCVIKGNVSYDSGERIYHMPGDEYYDVTVINPDYGERFFCTPEEAEAAGFRRAYN